ncbi:MFS transporter [Paenibacillus piscarius]|uniref:MFS transporter n=1 Tax=Paenibacillus piscarius TaxID=1089681 RepID=UPI001EE8ACD5|nr:glycoside-pentoside-hexuronide (GPH):cation symporter [Paenibacillus piscarius]
MGVATNETVEVNVREQETERISFWEKLSYGGGDLAFQLTWSLTTAFLLYFYTDVALIPVAATGVMFLVARILNGVFNPIMGAILDRTHTKHGKARPYFLYLTIPYGIICVLTFSTFDMSDGMKIAYGWFTFLLFGIIFSAMNSPYAAMLPMMARERKNKVALSSFRTIGMAVGALIVNSLTRPLIDFLGQGDEKLGFRLVALIYSVIGIALIYFMFFQAKERYTTVATKENKSNFWDDVKVAFKNRPWVTLLIFAMFNLMRVGIVTSITVYFALNVMKNSTMISVLLTMFSFGTLLSGFIAPVVFKKFSYRAGISIVFTGSIIGYIAMIFVQDHTMPFLIIYMITQVLAFVPTPAMFAMVADSIDFGEWKFGRRMEGFLSSTLSLGITVGSAIGVALVGSGLSVIGYVPGNVSDSVVSGLKMLYFGGPVIIMAIQIIVIQFYRLDQKQQDAIAQDLKKSR